MRRLLAIVAVLGAAAGALLLTGAKDDSSGKTYKIQFDNAFGLTEGGDFKVGGVRAGQTSKFDVDDSGPRPVAVVTAKLTVSGFDDLRKDARCRIRPQSLIGEYYVECQPGNSEEKIPDNGTVPVTQTESTIPQDLLNDVLRRPYRERLRLIISELGAGLAGRPQDLQAVLKRAHPGLRETSKVLRILGNQNKIIQDFIVNSDTVVGELEAKKRDVARWVTEAGKTAEISASRRQDIAASFHRLPTFLDELKSTMVPLGRLADEQRPLLTDLRRAAPDLREFFTRLGPFSEASRPSFRTLGDASVIGRKAFVDSKDEIVELRRLAKDAPGLGKPLRQFLQTIDDRSRSAEVDPRAKESAPPAPDKTAYTSGQGFTGMESILNYVYWQTLAINPFDQVSHVLRIVAIHSPCSPYMRGGDYKGNEELFKRCNSYLGPYQPGVTSPDKITAGGASSAAKARARDRTPARKRGERRGAGQPEAGPRPGQRDISKPQVVLPPPVRELIDKLRGTLDKPVPDLPKGGAGGDVAPDQLLDFLLAP
jgi:phospholipid/cholesterol/gamma-HCH transport system substrate-binding protein